MYLINANTMSATSICPTYCVFCTRSYEVGLDTLQLEKKGSFKQRRSQWEACLKYIGSNPEIQDVVVSGGDSFSISSEHLIEIGMRLISMPNVKKFRFASKGLAVSPNRFLDPTDQWTQALILVSQMAEKAGKRMALHTHFNHPNEISWITEKASRRLRDAGVTVRNQSVLLKGINDDVKTMGTLIRTLSDTLRIQPVCYHTQAHSNSSLLTFLSSTTSTSVTWFPKRNISELHYKPFLT